MTDLSDPGPTLPGRDRLTLLVGTEGFPMKLRSLFVFGAGVAVGVTVMRKLTEDDPEVLHGPQRAANGNPTMRMLSEQTAKISDRATVRSLDAIRKARGAIRERLADSSYDDAAWS